MPEDVQNNTVVNDDADLPVIGFDDFNNEVDSWADAPEDVKADLSGGHKGLPDLRKILSDYVTPEARRFVGNLRADYTRKTQDLAKLRRELEMEREAISREKLARVDGEHARRNAELAKVDTSTLDPYKAEDLDKLVEVKAAKIMSASIQSERDALNRERQRLLAQRFIEDHPEMKSESFKAELKALLTARKDLDLEDAYYQVKGRLSESSVVRQEAEALKAKEDKANARSTLLQTASGRSSLPSVTRPPKGANPQEVYEFYRNQSR